MSPYLVLLILEFLPARLATLPYGLDSNVTLLLANLLTKPSVFYYYYYYYCIANSLNYITNDFIRLLCSACKYVPHPESMILQ